jgi:hypothetical protein
MLGIALRVTFLWSDEAHWATYKKWGALNDFCLHAENMCTTFKER